VMPVPAFKLPACSRATGYAEVIPINSTEPLLPGCRQYGNHRNWLKSK
jgi:hypothetical protein